MKNPLKIIDFSTLIPGPFASYLLKKHFGAQVIKFEDKDTGDMLMHLRPTKEGIGLSYQAINQTKTIIQYEDPAEVFNHLKDADIFIENFKQGKTHKLGIGFEDVIKINPDIIYLTITGYPKNHPLGGRSAHDLNILATSGYLHNQIKLNKSVLPPPIQLADIITSYHLALQTISSFYKNLKGKHLTISMYDAIEEALILYNYPQLITSKESDPQDALMSGILPCYAIYQTKDDGYTAVAALEKPLWIDFCHHLKREDLTDKQFEIEAYGEISQEMKKYSRKDWITPNDFCVTPVLSVGEAHKLKYI